MKRSFFPIALSTLCVLSLTPATNAQTFPSSRTIRVELVKGAAISKFDAVDQADLYAKIRIDGGVTQETRKFNDNDLPQFNFISEQGVSSNKEAIDIEITLIDSDLGEDDVTDISPDLRSRTLKVKYFPRTGLVHDYQGDRIDFGRHGITSLGNDKSKTGMIHFKVTHR